MITGFTTLSNWINTNGYIWETAAPVSPLNSCNVISINGINVPKGRLPKTGYWTIRSTNGNSISDAINLNAEIINWEGAEVVLRKYRWVLDKYIINSATGNTINFSNNGDGVQPGWGYFIQNDLHTLTVERDWCFDINSKKIAVYSSSTPTDVKVPTIDQAVSLNNNDYVCFDNINNAGAISSVSGLIEGIYSFEIKVTDNNGATATDTMLVFVHPAIPNNQSPVASAVNDTTVCLPTNSIELKGNGTDADGQVVSYQWSVISGTGYQFSDSTKANCTIYDLQKGTYLLKLTVVDNAGAKGYALMQVTVGAGRLQTIMNADVTIFGNPVTDLLGVKISSSTIQPLQLSLLDMNGRLLIQQSISSNQVVQITEMNMSRFAAGSYILKVYFPGNITMSRQVIKK